MSVDPTGNHMMRTGAIIVESAQQAAADLQSGNSRGSNTVPYEEMGVLALDVNEEPDDTYDEELLDDLVAEGNALENNYMIDMDVFDIVR